MTVQANAACVDLLVWAAKDESTAENVLNRLADKIRSKDDYHIVSHLPLLLVCLRGMGRLAETFPQWTANVIDHLKYFLVEPSPILLRLYHESKSSGNSISRVPQMVVNNVAAEELAVVSTRAAYEKLRETAIDNLCLALKIGSKVILFFVYVVLV